MDSIGTIKWVLISEVSLIQGCQGSTILAHIVLKHIHPSLHTTMLHCYLLTLVVPRGGGEPSTSLHESLCDCEDWDREERPPGGRRVTTGGRGPRAGLFLPTSSMSGVRSSWGRFPVEEDELVSIGTEPSPVASCEQNGFVCLRKEVRHNYIH